MALMLLNGANYKRYNKVCNQLANQFTQGVDSYPKTIKSAACLLNNYKPFRVVQTFTGHWEEEEVAFSNGASESTKSSAAARNRARRPMSIPKASVEQDAAIR